MAIAIAHVCNGAVGESPKARETKPPIMNSGVDPAVGDEPT